MTTIVFQGDSITDAGRDRQDWNSLGYGYPLFAGCRIALEYPNEYQCLNRGVSGDCIVDVYSQYTGTAPGNIRGDHCNRNRQRFYHI